MDREPHYLKRVLEFGRTGAKPGTVTHITVLHDEWCAQLQDTGLCNCEPELQLEGRDG